MNIEKEERYSLYYTEKGTGTPLVLLHGNGESSAYFRTQISFFSQYYRVIAIDTRGHGKSPRGTAPFTLKQFAEDLKRFLDVHRLKEIFLLGFSDGGNIALLFALRYPEYVKKLVVNGANLAPSGLKLWVRLPVLVEYHIASLAARKRKKFTVKKEMLGLMAKQPDIAPETLHHLKIPTLVLVGKRDMIKRKHSELIAASLPLGVFQEISGDHFVALKNAALFNAVVKEFFNRNQ